MSERERERQSSKKSSIDAKRSSKSLCVCERERDIVQHIFSIYLNLYILIDF